MAQHLPAGDSDTAWRIRYANLMWLREQFRREWEQSFPPGASPVGLDRDFAADIGVTPKSFAHVKMRRRNIGNTLARQIEERKRLPMGWMDVAHPDTDGEAEEERELVASLLQLYRDDPENTRVLMMRAMKEHLARRSKR